MKSAKYFDGIISVEPTEDGQAKVYETNSYFCRGRAKVVYEGSLANCLIFFDELINSNS